MAVLLVLRALLPALKALLHALKALLLVLKTLLHALRALRLAPRASLLARKTLLPVLKALSVALKALSLALKALSVALKALFVALTALFVALKLLFFALKVLLVVLTVLPPPALRRADPWIACRQALQLAPTLPRLAQGVSTGGLILTLEQPRPPQPPALPQAGLRVIDCSGSRVTPVRHRWAIRQPTGPARALVSTGFRRQGLPAP